MRILEVVPIQRLAVGRSAVRRAASVSLIALGLILGNAWGAVDVKIVANGGKSTDTATEPTCTGFFDGKTYFHCTSDAFISTSAIDGSNTFFGYAFAAWNSMNPVSGKWTLVDGGNLPGGKLEVTTFRAIVGASTGGMEINVNWTYNGADKGDYFWAQGLLSDYTVSPPSSDGLYFKMDVKAAGCDNTDLLKKCPPLYPYQYADRSFYDQPTGPMPSAQWEAWDFLSKTNFTNRTLTIYEGIYYGYTLSASPVPEPRTYAMMLAGLIMLVAMRRMKGIAI